MEDKFLKTFCDNKIWATKNARFTASRRMKRNKVSSNVAMSMLSFQIIAINLLTFLSSFKEYEQRITIITIILSGFTLVLSLLISLLQYEKRETNYHQCGIELDYLNQDIQLAMSREEPLSFKDKETYIQKYFNIIEKYNLNHTTFDYMYAADKYNVNERFLRWYVFDINTFYWALVIVVPLVSLFVIKCPYVLMKMISLA